MTETELLTDDTLDIVAKFQISELRMKSDWIWRIRMSVEKVLPTTHRGYKVRLEFDSTPWDERIAQMERDLQELSDNPSLLPDIDRRSLNDLETQIGAERAELRDMVEECTDIEFTASTEEIKHADNSTKLLLVVSDKTIEPINEKKTLLLHYQAVLTPIF